MTKEMLENISLPRHIGIIMDGNGRWAKQRGLPRSEGHKAGAKTFRAICDYGAELGIECLTFYAFSTENWKRPADEVAAIMNLFRDYLTEAEEREEENAVKGMRIRYIGDRTALPADIVDMIDKLEENSADKRTITINLAVNYGGRDEILHAVRAVAQKVQAGELKAQDITLNDIDGNLYTAGLPDPDLIIRPSGEYRLSNFLIWQAAYSELWFSDILWPDFTADDLDKAIIDYGKRNRRFGGV
ncbi:MAG: isoprenyl transferase [Oscillospiraceae bacterium]|nr:isoprenyl transferase [Clostridiaceae bacterium]MDO4496025.1 isoprenyl transferase [Clostridiaceae bacterium]MDY5948831.1 isoprenyl transferase [Oscillospiraceae bacterium]